MESSTNALKVWKNPHEHLKSVLLQGVLEGLIDGILVLTEQGELVHANGNAYQILEQLSQNEMQTHLIHKEMRRVCQAVIDSLELFPDKSIIVESEVLIEASKVVRIRARWFRLETFNQPLVLLALEDQHQSNQSRAIAEVQKYQLTPREAEIWLLRRANYTYQEIATELVISLNTVKKHLKNIYDKFKFHEPGQYSYHQLEYSSPKPVAREA
ncbi:LuxR C-terminal-related transcriptional regulator [Kovacikia minuta CCNUW1]|uniref:helix-turn-helix transcriptional regulator n=1 Tax=Kovacikia minuta TaxID=2931930 RepID=UPI001CCCF750|nr:LuxR C-terminal-related transcriptional regulator [Kovacikia minuta]UBF26275.1 LuxR C-terminal-related transcriptional regulator [Kovacikia minuta CCNUW1]